MNSKVRVRIAPSPTGHLHLGTARTALYNYLFARHNHGDFVMRLEDTDEVRSNESYTQDILAGLKWLGLNWDEGPDIGGPYLPYKQTEKIDHYEQIARKLVSLGKAYFCYATAEELDSLREDQKSKSEAVRYDNRGRHYTKQQIEQFEKEGRAPVIRFKVEESRLISWHDAIKGEIQIHSDDLGGDMVIVKSNGISTYNFAVVVDDIDMKITHVIRGEDHVHNTAKQILLYEALNAEMPKFAHVPLIFDMDRQKLSKRKHGEAVHINKYKLDGYMPEALVNYLTQMSWTPTDGKELFSIEHACEIFDLEKVSKSPAIFDIKRLDWFNAHYIRSLPLAEIVKRAMPYLEHFPTEKYTSSELEQIIALTRDSLTKLSDLAEATEFFFIDMPQIASELSEGILKQASAKAVISKLLSNLDKFPWENSKECKASIDQIGKELALKGKELYWPIRAALCGSTSGPDLGAILAILGEKRTRSRLESLMQYC